MSESEARTWISVLRKLTGNPLWDAQQQAYGAHAWTPTNEAWAVVLYANQEREHIDAIFNGPSLLVGYLDYNLNVHGLWQPPVIVYREQRKFVERIEPMSEK
jgi:hypothetical protein